MGRMMGMLATIAFAATAQAQETPATLGASNHAVDVAIAPPGGSPTFADEFSGKRIDPANWRFDTSRNRAGWYNNERQYYAPANTPANARVEKGALVIEARRETPKGPDAGGQAYTSARIVSTRPMGYGFYDIRAKLPCGRGIWPALWMLPPNGTWPAGGEIDILELVGYEPGLVHATLHSAAFNHARGTQRGGSLKMRTACGEWHRYQLDWKPDSITIGVDGRGYMRVDNDQPGGQAAWPFDRPFNLIMNVAVGGDWGGKMGIDDTRFPQSMKVDYVRYWQYR
ncbi:MULTISPECIES: glycoside hydrolase family 16 protein [Sphingomonas]|jgi:beta-glucanase (GH16 family)|nr:MULTISPECIES: glycoside hydrolase family 16 protein [Sphingomonas]PZT94128.1 MAG: glycoside hydrolase family 16 protein [Sphingomonas sp.]RSV21730.1 glycoside hydrolase family 16 protein [Sphingomonas sp. ABOLH]